MLISQRSLQKSRALAHPAPVAAPEPLHPAGPAIDIISNCLLYAAKVAGRAVGSVPGSASKDTEGIQETGDVQESRTDDGQLLVAGTRRAAAGGWDETGGRGLRRDGQLRV